MDRHYLEGDQAIDSDRLPIFDEPVHFAEVWKCPDQGSRLSRHPKVCQHPDLLKKEDQQYPRADAVGFQTGVPLGDHREEPHGPGQERQDR